MILALAATALAQEGQLRRIQLADGRVLYAELVGQTPEGLEVRLAQGAAVVGYDEISGLQPVDAATVAAAPAWSVALIGPGPLAARLALHFEEVPSVDVVSADRLLPPEAVARCGADANCMAAAMPDGEWAWFVHVGEEQIEIAAGSGLPHRNLALGDGADEALWALVHHAMGLRASSAPAPVTVAPPPPPPPPLVVPPPDAFALRNARAWTPERVDRLALVPVPGLAALRMGDGEHFAVALATALPATAGFAWAVGAASDDAVEGAVVGTLGGFAIVTAINQITGRRALNSTGGD